MAQANSEAAVCNMALARVGHRQFIDDFEDEALEAQLSAIFYTEARDAVLAALDWRFARRRTVLAELAIERTGWTYVYRLPSDCIAARRLVGSSRTPSSKERIAFEVESDGSVGGILLTDQEAAELVYTARVEEVPRFSPHFKDALAWRLAQDFCLSLPVKPQFAAGIEQKYRAVLAEAMALDMNQGQEGELPESEFIRER